MIPHRTKIQQDKSCRFYVVIHLPRSVYWETARRKEQEVTSFIQQEYYGARVLKRGLHIPLLPNFPLSENTPLNIKYLFSFSHSCLFLLLTFIYLISLWTFRIYFCWINKLKEEEPLNRQKSLGVLLLAKQEIAAHGCNYQCRNLAEFLHFKIMRYTTSF